MSLFTKLWEFREDKVNRLNDNGKQTKESLEPAGSKLLVAYQLFGLCGLISIAGFTSEIQFLGQLFVADQIDLLEEENLRNSDLKRLLCFLQGLSPSRLDIYYSHPPNSQIV